MPWQPGPPVGQLVDEDQTLHKSAAKSTILLGPVDSQPALGLQLAVELLRRRSWPIARRQFPHDFWSQLRLDKADDFFSESAFLGAEAELHAVLLLDVSSGQKFSLPFSNSQQSVH